jgi:asparagine synthetase B (glutamine-hydrolysing)
VRWLQRDEVDGFDALFEKVVARAMGTDRVGVYLSGGLDSISVAAMAGDIARRRTSERPMALSLAFPAPCDESAIQMAVADALEFDRELLPFDEAVGTRGLFARALELGATWPMPMTNLWNPAYAALASRGAAQGCRTILTGRGGDEWLTLSPCYAADLIAQADVPGLWRLMRGVRSSRDYAWRQILRRTFWTFGLRPLLGQVRARVAPGVWRVHHERRADRDVPDWVAPDSALRRQLTERSRRRLTPQDSSNGFYVRDMRHGLLHPLVGLDLEDSWEMGRRLGLRIRHPFWDAELVDFLFRIPPEVLNQPRPAKWLVRETVSRRFPGLGLDRQKKVAATGVFSSRLVREAPRLWEQMGGPRRLAEFGVVDRGRLETGLSQLVGSGDVMKLTTIWRIMNLENWARNQPV